MTAEAGNGTDAGSFEDRSARLVLFGIVTVGLGLLSVGLGLLQVALAFFGTLLPGATSMPTDAPTLFMGATLYGLIGAMLVWLGIGSTLKRRWVPPLMLTLGWTWLASGALSAIFIPLLMDSLALTAPAPETAGLFQAAKLFVLVIVVCFGVVLPAIFIWVYRDRNLVRTCEAHDPGPAWTERCPTAVLGLSVGLGGCALITLPMLARPALPFFTVVLTGWQAVVVLLAGALACAYLARSTYRLEMSGWWGTVALLSFLGLATGIAFAILDPGELYRALGYPESQVEALAGAGIAGGRPATLFTVAFTAASLVYMARIRKHFR